jgi:energy-coupling factor transport system ATP-binding protein
VTDAPILRVEGVRIRHEGSEVFTPDGVSFDVRPGEVVLVLGPSGSGKSTLALALNGLVPHALPAELGGRVVVEATASVDTTVARLSERVSMVFQDPDAQIVTGTVLDEVCFGPENLRLPVEDVLLRAEAALRQVGLWDRRDENPDRLSGGGRQRLALACALALQTPVIVLDEPTANLDPRGIDEVYAVLGRLVAERRHAIVLIEHNLDAAMGLVDRVVVLDRSGALRFDGPAGSVLRENVDELLRLGVWLPTATLAGMRLRAAGYEVAELPLTPDALTTLVDTLPPPLSPVATGGRVRTVAEGAAGPAVRVRGLTVTRSGTEVLHGIDLEVARGDFVALVGVNGAGKTTLLQSIAGVVAPPRRSVDVLGLDPARADLRELARTIGFVFQNPEHQFVRGTVADELAHGLERQRVARPDIDRRVDRMLERFGLAGARQVHPFLLSGGQKRRLSVGTALIAGAPVLALDEPTFGQDRERAAELLAILAGLHAEGTTVLVVTHDLQLVADFATHIAVLDGGRLAAYGTTSDVLASDALDRAGLQPPPLVRALRAAAHPSWHGVTRLDDLPDARRAPDTGASSDTPERPVP